MYTITKIDPVKGGRGRARVFLDGAFAFTLYETELREYGITEGGMLDGAVFREITETVLVKRAKLRAMHLLEKRPYTEHTLRGKLADGDYPEDVIDAAIAYVKSFGYINDLQYATDHITYHIADRNRRRLETDLLKKGIDRAVIAEAFSQCYAEADESGDNSSARDYEIEMIRKELRKKHFDPETADYETKARLKASLLRKGFSPEIVSDVVN